MVSEDLIIGMELNFLKTKRKKERIKKKKEKRREKKKERKKERRDRDQGGKNATSQDQKQLFCKILCCYV